MLFFKKIISFFITLAMLISSNAGGIFAMNDTLKIDTEKEFQKMVTWGTSSAWWSQQMKNCETADKIAKLLYDKDEGLGLNVYRFNIGAGEKENPDTRISIENRKTESFYYYNEKEGRYIYDFSRDSAAVMMMDKAIAAGADSIIMFCNSPHYSMTVSGQASGGLEPAFSNLPEKNYQAFADYVLTIADHFVEKGYPVKYISPINEPQWEWGGEQVTQEGCHFEPKEAIKLLEVFAVTMQKRGTPYGLLGIESGELSRKYYDYIDLFAKSKILMSYCDTFCAHSYWIDNEVNTKIKAGTRVKTLMPDKIFEMSEWCELPCKLDATSIDSALYMANVIAEDLRYLGVNSWSTWTACGIGNNCHSVTGSDRLFAVESDMSDFAIMKRFYALRHFSAFIPAGSVRVDAQEGKNHDGILSVAYRRPDGRIATVIINNSTEKQSINLGTYKIEEMYVTDSIRNCEKADTQHLTNTFTAYSRSISTVILAS